MRNKRILIVGTGSLLMEGVEGLLQSYLHAGVDFVSTSTRDVDVLMREIERWNPGIILMEDMTPFITPAHLVTSLPHSRNIQVIALSSQANKADVYHKSSADLYDKSELSLSDPNRFIAALAYG
ncbi:MAG: hypothetical protein AB1649_22500 [Chloroflexota bacterium]